jgi:periplasmic divalent cation tolerance protein
MGALLVYTTFASKDDARPIIDAAIEGCFAAGANLFPAHESTYWWGGKVQRAEEVAVIFKTTAENFETLKNLIVEMHSYDTPCVVALDVQDAHDPFLKWISETVSK